MIKYLDHSWLGGGVLAAVVATACLDTSGIISGPSAFFRPVDPSQISGSWVAHVTGGVYDSHVQLFRVIPNSESGISFEVVGFTARSWAGMPTLDFPPHGVGRLVGDSLYLRFGEAPALVSVAAGLQNDTLSGIATDTVGGHPFVAIRIDQRILAWDASHMQPVNSPTNSSPCVVVRLDDAPYTDGAFTDRLRARGLVAEIAVPTKLIGNENRLGWSDLSNLAGEGFGIAAHSRFHAPTTASPGNFLFEVVGSLDDLAAHGLPTGVFVQPGSWQDSLNFDSVDKLVGWHGALMRTVTAVFENYVYIGSLTPTDSLRWRLGWVSISDTIGSTTILNRWRSATRADRITVFQVHTISLAEDPTRLDWFLDSLQVARASGRIRLFGSTAEALSDFNRSSGGLIP